jgi:hypothetical protein
MCAPLKSLFTSPAYRQAQNLTWYGAGRLYEREEKIRSFVLQESADDGGVIDFSHNLI